MKSEPIDVLLKPFNKFISGESTSGILLFISALVAMIWANSPLSHSYHTLWHFTFSITIGEYTISNTLHHWINDGLMSMFFFVVGLELKGEIMAGDLSSPRQALLPLAAAAGGMILPALIFVLFNSESPHRDGWGIPMATDIAFALGILSLLGKRVPVSLKVFLTALAIADDLGAVLVIAFFYTSDISFASLGTGAAFIAVLVAGNLLGVRNTLFYGIIGIGGLWLAFLMSGVHATIAGVLAAWTIPARTKIDELAFSKRLKDLVNEFMSIPPNDVTLLEPEQMHVIDKIKRITRYAETPLQRLEHTMHPMVAFVVLPLFALANAGIEFSGSFFSDLMHPISLGTMLGLVVGKLIGISGICFLLIKLKAVALPDDVTWRHLIGCSMLAGVGFTMSLFVTNLAYTNETYNLLAKTGTMTASLISGVAGFIVLRTAKPVLRPMPLS